MHDNARHSAPKTRAGRMLLAVLVLCMAAAPAWAQRSGEVPPEFEGVGVTERLGEQLPLDLTFRNADGETVQLGSFFDGERPVLLTMVYFDCPMLCNLLLDHATAELATIPWTPGEEYEHVTVSFAPDETPEQAARWKERYVEQLGRPEAAAGWHFLTGDSLATAQLAEALGYRFNYVEANGEYAHPSVFMFADGQGRITRYLEALASTSREMRLALVEAGEGRVGSPLDRLIQYCFQFDPQQSAYVLHATNVMKLGGLLTVVVLGGLLFVFWRRESHVATPPTDVQAA